MPRRRPRPPDAPWLLEGAQTTLEIVRALSRRQSIAVAAVVVFAAAFWKLRPRGARAALEAAGVSTSRVAKITFGVLDLQKRDADGRYRTITELSTITDPDAIARFLDVLATGNETYMAKILTRFELEFLLRDGSRRRFRIGDQVLRPDVAASALAQTWVYGEGALAPFLPLAPSG